MRTSEPRSLFDHASCMCAAVDSDTAETGWRPCPTSLCERTDHDHSVTQYVVAFVRRNAMVTLAAIRADVPESAVAEAKRRLTVGELLDIVETRVMEANEHTKALIS